MAKNEEYEEELEDEYEEYEDEEDEDEEEDYSVEGQKRDILKMMKRYNPLTKEYMVLSQRLNELTESAKNEAQEKAANAQETAIEDGKGTQILQILAPVAGNLVGSLAANMLNRRNVKDTLHYEDEGGIVKSRATSFISKPRM